MKEQGARSNQGCCCWGNVTFVGMWNQKQHGFDKVHLPLKLSLIFTVYLGPCCLLHNCTHNWDSSIVQGHLCDNCVIHHLLFIVQNYVSVVTQHALERRTVPKVAAATRGTNWHEWHKNLEVIYFALKEWWKKMHLIKNFQSGCTRSMCINAFPYMCVTAVQADV